VFFHLVSAAVKGDVIDLFTTVGLSEVEDFSCFCQRHLFGYPFKSNYKSRIVYFLSHFKIITNVDESQKLENYCQFSG